MSKKDPRADIHIKELYQWPKSRNLHPTKNMNNMSNHGNKSPLETSIPNAVLSEKKQLRVMRMTVNSKQQL